MGRTRSLPVSPTIPVCSLWAKDEDDDAQVKWRSHSTRFDLSSCPDDILNHICEFLSVDNLVTMFQSGDRRLATALQTKVKATKWVCRMNLSPHEAQPARSLSLPSNIFPALKSFSSLQSLEIDPLEHYGWAEAMNYLPNGLTSLSLRYQGTFDSFFVSVPRKLAKDQRRMANESQPAHSSGSMGATTTKESDSDDEVDRSANFEVFGRFENLVTLCLKTSPAYNKDLPIAPTLRFLYSLPLSLTSLHCRPLASSPITVVKAFPRQLLVLDWGSNLELDLVQYLPPKLQSLKCAIVSAASPGAFNEFSCLPHLTSLHGDLDCRDFTEESAVFQGGSLAHLSSLSIRKVPDSFASNLPSWLDTLHIDDSSLLDASFACLPRTVTDLRYRDMSSPGDVKWTNRASFLLPSQLLKLHWITEKRVDEVFFSGIPRSVRHLDLDWQNAASGWSSLLPPALEFLSCNSDWIDDDISHLPTTLKTLVLHGSDCTSLFAGNLPKGITKLHLETSERLDSHVARLLPRSLHIINLWKIDLGGPVEGLNEESLNLRTLEDVCEARITHFMEGLPRGALFSAWFVFDSKFVRTSPYLAKLSTFYKPDTSHRKPKTVRGQLNFF